MNKRIILSLALSLGFGLPSMAQVVIPEGNTFQVASGLMASERAFDRADRMVTNLEYRVNRYDSTMDADDDDYYYAFSTQNADLDSDLNDVRYMVLIRDRAVLEQHPAYDTLVDRMYDLRRDYIRMGEDVGTWSDWNYDGRQLDTQEMTLIEGLENSFRQLGRDIRLGVSNALYNESSEAILDNIRDTLNMPEFRSNPDLAYYRTQIANEQLNAYEQMNQQKRVNFVESAINNIWSWFDDSFSPNDKERVQRIQDESDRVLRTISVMERNQLNLPDYQITLDLDGTPTVWKLNDAKAQLIEVRRDPGVYYQTYILTE